MRRKDHRVRRIAWRLLTLLTATAAGAVLTGCPPAATELKEYAYEIEVTVRGSSGTGLELTVVNAETGAEVAPAVGPGAATPTFTTASGIIDYDAPFPVAVTATVTDLGDTESFTVSVVYTDTVYTDPVSYTVRRGTVSNVTGGPAPLTYSTQFVIPYAPRSR